MSELIIAAEDDPFIRLVEIVLDPRVSEERLAAFADFFAHDLPDFEGWRRRVRAAAGGLYPAEVRLCGDEAELRKALPGAQLVVVESLRMGREELAAADSLRLVQKFGQVLRNVDLQACAERGIPVRTLRRRANVACAEHTLALMLAFAKKLHRITGRITVEALTEAGYSPRGFDRRHTAGSGWARIPHIGMLYEGTLGIVGMGEIGRELAVRAWALGMRVLYYQRTRLADAEEEHLHIEYRPLEDLLAEAGWVSLQLPRGAGAVMNAERLARMQPGAYLINTSQAEHVDRDAVLGALRSGRLGGFALDPLYQEPGSADDELLQFDNVILTPHIAAQPRFNALKDMEEMLVGLARAPRDKSPG